MRRAARTDANQTNIVDALRRCGCLVLPLHQMGQGVPDLLICHRGALAFVEVKDGDKSPSKRKLTVDQETWHRQWADAPVYVLESVEHVPALLARVAGDWGV